MRCRCKWLVGITAATLWVVAADNRPRRVWAERGTNTLGAPSGDGRFLSFVDAETGDLALLDVVTGGKRRLTDNHARGKSDEFAYFSVIAPNGREVAYAWFNDEKFYDLRVTSAAAGAKPRLLYRNEEAGFVQPCAWSPDGKRILTLFFRKDNISQIAFVSAVDGSVEILKSLNWVYPNRMDLSPDGRYIIYDDLSASGSAQRDIFLLSADGSREVRLIDHAANDLFPLWMRGGEGVLFVSDRSGTNDLWFVPVRDDKNRGEPMLVRRDLGRILPMGVSRDGAYYYGVRTGATELRVASLDMDAGRVAESQALTTSRLAAAGTTPEWSPDGRSLAYLVRTGNENFGQEFRAIAVRSVASGAEREVAPNLAFIESLRWAPNGRAFLIGGSDRHGFSGLYLVDARNGDTKPVVRERASTYRGFQGQWSADGGAVVYMRNDAAAPQVRLLRLQTGAEQELYRAESGVRLRHPSFSLDGQHLALSSWNGKDHIETLMVMPAAGGAPRVIATVRNAEVKSLEWMPGGKELLFLTPGQPPSIWRAQLDGRPPQRLQTTLDGYSTFRLHPDGKRLALISGAMRSEVWAIDNAVPAANER